MEFIKKLASSVPIRYMTVLFCVMLLLITVIVYCVYSYKKKKDVTITWVICVAVIGIEALLFSCAHFPALRCDPVHICAIETYDQGVSDGDVKLKSISINSKEIPFPKVESGKWSWMDGMYCWSSEDDKTFRGGVTQEIVLLIPVGTERVLTFDTDEKSGCVGITVRGHTKTVDLHSQIEKNQQVRIDNSSTREQFINAVLSILLYLVIHVLVFLSIVVFVKPLYKSFVWLITHYKYELSILLFSLLSIVKYTRFPNYHEYSSTFYFNSYEFGFIKRGLLGEILTSIQPYLTVRVLLYWKLFVGVLVYSAISVLVGHEVKRQNNERTRWFFVLLICSLPSTFELVHDDFRFDVYIFLLFLICIVLIAMRRGVWFLPILSTCILLIGEVSCIYMIPFLAAALFYLYSRNKEKRYLYSMIGIVISTITFMGLFLLLDDPRKVFEGSEIVSHIQNHFEGLVNTAAINAEMQGLSYVLADANRKIAAVHSRKAALFFLSLIPAFLMFSIIWKRLFKCWKEDQARSKVQKIAFWLLPISGLGAFIVMLISYDYGRYCVFMFGEEIAAVFLFLRTEGIQLNYSDLRLSQQKSEGYNILPIVICVFYLYFGVLGSGVMDTAIVNQWDKFISGFIAP